jgi:putative RNA 2'-phosphotransferase
MDLEHWSKLLSRVLRHRPDLVGIKLDKAGWASIEKLLAKLQVRDPTWDLARLMRVVERNDKQRFALSEDRKRIRAVHGHSVPVELGYGPSRPPKQLFHGTTRVALSGIRDKGILKGHRRHVHLSVDHTTAMSVGSRRGRAVVLAVRAGDMHRAGFSFACSSNGVWLVDRVPIEFIDFQV